MPKRVFLSYKRHSDPDESLVLEIRRALGEAGHQVKSVACVDLQLFETPGIACAEPSL